MGAQEIMKLLPLFVASVAASGSLLDCDVTGLFDVTCSVEEGFYITVASSLSSDCEAMITSREYTAVPVATGDAAPSSGNCHGGGVSLNSGVSVLDVLNFHPTCYSKSSGSNTLDILADVYLMDNEGNRPFNKLSIQCNIPTAVTFADLTFGITDTAIDASGTTLSAPFEIGADVFFYVDITMHGSLQFTNTACSIDGTEISSTYKFTSDSCWTYTASGQSFGECIKITAKNDDDHTVSCSAEIEFAP